MALDGGRFRYQNGRPNDNPGNCRVALTTMAGTLDGGNKNCTFRNWCFGGDIDDVSKGSVVEGGSWGGNSSIGEGDLGNGVPLDSKEKTKRDSGGGNKGSP